MRWQRIRRCVWPSSTIQCTRWKTDSGINLHVCLPMIKKQQFYIVYLISEKKKKNGNNKTGWLHIYVRALSIKQKQHHKPIYCLWLLKPFNVVVSFVTAFLLLLFWMADQQRQFCVFLFDVICFARFLIKFPWFSCNCTDQFCFLVTVTK